jgi:hypothetical protein
MLRVLVVGVVAGLVAVEKHPDGRRGIIFKLSFGNRPDECQEKTGGYEKTCCNQNDDNAHEFVLGKSSGGRQRAG